MLWLAAKTRLMANIILKKWQQNRFYIESSTFDYVNKKTNKQKTHTHSKRWASAPTAIPYYLEWSRAPCKMNLWFFSILKFMNNFNKIGKLVCQGYWILHCTFWHAAVILESEKNETKLFQCFKIHFQLKTTKYWLEPINGIYVISPNK